MDFCCSHRSKARVSGESYEDDGESEAWRENAFGAWCVGVTVETGALQVRVSRSGRFAESPDELVLVLPGNEARPVNLSGAQLIEESGANGQRRLRVRLVPRPAAC